MSAQAVRGVNQLKTTRSAGKDYDDAVAAEKETVASVASDEAALTTALSKLASTTASCRSVEGQRNQRESLSPDRSSRRPRHCSRARHAPLH